MPKRSPNAYSLSNYLQRIETYLIREAMDTHAGNVCHTARSLGMGYTTLQWKLKKMMIDPNEYRKSPTHPGGMGSSNEHVSAKETLHSSNKQADRKNQKKTKHVKKMTQSETDALKKLEAI